MSRSASARAVSTRAATISVVRLPLGEADIRPSFRRERAAMKRGVWPIAGCDEAGRGPLAGPVVAAAVVLDPKRVPRGLDDSKKLDPQTREKLHGKICASAQVAVAFAPPWRIDRDNILRASLWALARLGPTIHHRRSFAPVAAAYGDVVTGDMETGEIEPGVLPL